MKIWIATLLSDCVIPLTLVVGGYLMMLHPPKKINHFCGYRTNRSTKNMDTWLFAHKTCGKLWLIAGGVMLIPTVLIHLPFLHSTDDALAVLTTVLMIVQFCVLGVTVYKVENALKERFDDNGNLK